MNYLYAKTNAGDGVDSLHNSVYALNNSAVC